MAILTDARAEVLLRQARSKPSIPFTSVSVPEMLEDCRLSLFPSVIARVPCFFVDRGPLACICRNEGRQDAVVFIHDILNRPDVPAEVFRHICIHELTHLVVLPRFEDGRERTHPSEFWELEAQLSPCRQAAMRWIWSYLGAYLRHNEKREGINVLKGWKRSWGAPLMPLIEPPRPEDLFL